MIYFIQGNTMDTKDEEGIKDLETNKLIDLYKEVADFISFLYEEQKKNEEG